MHYGGVGCDMDALGALAREHGLLLVEDAAQGIGAALDGRALGAIGDLGTLSFHETKNVSCGEGGALLVNDERWAERAEILQEKGTNRQRFARGEVDRYTWVDVGSSFLMSDVSAALLAEQLERVAEITAARLRDLGRLPRGARAARAGRGAAPSGDPAGGAPQRPPVPDHARRPGRPRRADRARSRPTRSARTSTTCRCTPRPPAGSSAAPHGSLAVTDAAADRLIRLPLWVGMTEGDVARVAQGVAAAT